VDEAGIVLQGTRTVCHNTELKTIRQCNVTKWITRTQLRLVQGGSEIRCSRGVSSSCSTSCTRRITLTICHRFDGYVNGLVHINDQGKVEETITWHSWNITSLALNKYSYSCGNHKCIAYKPITARTPTYIVHCLEACFHHTYINPFSPGVISNQSVISMSVSTELVI
jgi:hypothetical protein